MKDTKSGASAKVAGREFHNGMVQGKKLYFKVSVDVAYCLSFLPCCDLVLVEAGVTKSAAGISTRPLMILNIIVTCDLDLLVSSDTLQVGERLKLYKEENYAIKSNEYLE